VPRRATEGAGTARNEPALGFYRSLGAVSLDEWRTHRLTGDALHLLASSTAEYHPAP
jgi:hypothetical protein